MQHKMNQEWPKKELLVIWGINASENLGQENRK